eukprot:1637175-Rhodomonas_salina.2
MEREGEREEEEKRQTELARDRWSGVTLRMDPSETRNSGAMPISLRARYAMSGTVRDRQPESVQSVLCCYAYLPSGCHAVFCTDTAYRATSREFASALSLAFHQHAPLRANCHSKLAINGRVRLLCRSFSLPLWPPRLRARLRYAWCTALGTSPLCDAMCYAIVLYYAMCYAIVSYYAMCYAIVFYDAVCYALVSCYVLCYAIVMYHATCYQLTCSSTIASALCWAMCYQLVHHTLGQYRTSHSIIHSRP